MAAEYPAAVPTFVGTTETAPATTTPSDFAAWAQKVEDETVALATELGLDPAGPSATVRDRLDSVDSRGFPASYHGLKAWTYDPLACAAGATIWPNTTGTMRTIRMWTPTPITVSAIWVIVTAVGVTLTAGNNRAALFDAAGAFITNGLTNDQATAWTSTGGKQMDLATPASVPAGAFDVGIWVNGTTAPTFLRATANVQASALNVSGVNIRYAGTTQTGLTNTAPANVGTKSAAGEGWWVGVS